MKPFYNSICRFALVSLAALPMLTISSPSRANVTITPTLVVIEGRDRYADLNLLNITGVPHTYAIGWRFMKMICEDGVYENAEKSLTDFDLTKNIVFTPKRVTIEGGGMQKIRLGLRLKGERAERAALFVVVQDVEVANGRGGVAGGRRLDGVVDRRGVGLSGAE